MAGKQRQTRLYERRNNGERKHWQERVKQGKDYVYLPVFLVRVKEFATTVDS